MSLAVREGLFHTVSDGSVRLLGGRCGECDRPHFPRGEVCPYCSAGACAEVELGPRGRLWLHTAVTQPPPGYRGRVPYGFGVVELDEGLRVVGRLTEADPGKLAAGQPMHLVTERINPAEEAEEVVAWAFAPGET